MTAATVELLPTAGPISSPTVGSGRRNAPDRNAPGRGNLLRQLAERGKAAFCITVGESELAAGTVVLKNFATTEQTNVPQGELVARLRELTGAA